MARIGSKKRTGGQRPSSSLSTRSGKNKSTATSIAAPSKRRSSASTTPAKHAEQPNKRSRHSKARDEDARASVDARWREGLNPKPATPRTRMPTAGSVDDTLARFQTMLQH